MVRTICDFPLPYAPTRTLALSVDSGDMLCRISFRSLREEFVGMKFLSLSSLLRS